MYIHDYAFVFKKVSHLFCFTEIELIHADGIEKDEPGVKRSETEMREW
jgi:hypothetical protein